MDRRPSRGRHLLSRRHDGLCHRVISKTCAHSPVPFLSFFLSFFKGARADERNIQQDDKSNTAQLKRQYKGSLRQRV